MIGDLTSPPLPPLRGHLLRNVLISIENFLMRITPAARSICRETSITEACITISCLLSCGTQDYAREVTVWGNRRGVQEERRGGKAARRVHHKLSAPSLRHPSCRTCQASTPSPVPEHPLR